MRTRVPTIFVDHGGPAVTNVGDLAMLMVALRRLRGLFPNARLIVPTDDPDRLRHFCPGVETVSEAALALLQWRRAVPPRLSRRLPVLGRWAAAGATRWPLATLRLRSWRNALRGERPAETQDCLHALRDADLFVAAGGGYLNDLFPHHVTRVLGVLRVALPRRRPIALLGQGLGPISEPAHLAGLTEVLRAARIIGLREDLSSRSLLRRCGALDGRAWTTGDDALELAWERRPPVTGVAVGFNVRVARYAAIEAEGLEPVRRTLDKFTKARAVPILPCPITFDQQGGDLESTRNVVGGLPQFDAGCCANDPAVVIDQIGRCRVVVTGSYHAGVFALAQGIPVIGLTKSPYYLQKFSGLAAQFGAGCVVVRMDDPGFETVLRRQLDRLWEQSPELRAALLAATEAQIQAGHAAYSGLPALLP